MHPGMPDRPCTSHHPGMPRLPVLPTSSLSSPPNPAPASPPPPAVECAEGRVFLDPNLPELAPGQRSAVYRHMAQVGRVGGGGSGGWGRGFAGGGGGGSGGWGGGRRQRGWRQGLSAQSQGRHTGMPERDVGIGMQARVKGVGARLGSIQVGVSSALLFLHLLLRLRAACHAPPCHRPHRCWPGCTRWTPPAWAWPPGTAIPTTTARGS